MNDNSLTPQTLLDEFSSVDLGDHRRGARLLEMVIRLLPSPHRSFPEAMRTSKELEGAYRFLGNPDISPEALLLPHQVATLARAKQAGEVLVAHDTTAFHFGGSSRRGELGRISGEGPGFLGHFALCLTADGTRDPLGVLGLHPLFRTGPKKGTGS